MRTFIKTLVDGSSCFGVTLTTDQAGQFELLATELHKWNSKINLTSIGNDVDVAIKHFVDSIAPLKYLRGCRTLLDIGSGGGFPSIPLRICSDIEEIYSIDAVGKKINFQKHVARMLKLSGFKAIHCRGEDMPEKYAKYFDIIVSRAFTDIPKFVQLAKPLLHENGRIIAMKGKQGVEEAGAATNEIVGLGMRIENVEEYELPIAGDSRSLIIIRNQI